MPHEPKKKHAKSAKKTRRSSIALSGINLIVCPNCNEKTLSHMICRNCGSYAGKKIKGFKKAVKVIKA